MANEKAVMISVNKPHTDNIFSGDKGLEWRKKPLPEGLHYVYETKNKGGCGMVIGEMYITGSLAVDTNGPLPVGLVNAGCVHPVTLKKYANNGIVYANFIQDAKRYDKPKPLSAYGTKHKCTGSRRRDSSSAVNNQSPSGAAAKALDNMTQEQIFLKLTNNGKLQGLFMKDGELYVNASFLAAGLISSADGKIVIDLENSGIPVFNTGISTNGITVRSDQAGATELFSVITALREYYGDYEAIIRMKNADGDTFCEIRETTSADGLHTGGQMVIKGIGNPNEVVVRAGTFDAGIGCHDTEGVAAAQLGIVGSEGTLWVDNIDVTGRGNCKWEYISSIGKTVLVQI